MRWGSASSYPRSWQTRATRWWSRRAPAKPAAPVDNNKAQPTALQGYMEYNPFTKSWTWKVRYPPPSK